ncbi:hypothetical protein FNV43_RR23676 [Rhamnella rubrinervis]|uniref:Uncharacterized protein n=1 Tax=Rhamnella rubrinervis TaxID=2594499 RepID=A0A8K0GSB0_9ROSA|nr:hypothetical protein FNV43_RR23676 [Rhamnella rubrinervis]
MESGSRKRKRCHVYEKEKEKEKEKGEEEENEEEKIKRFFELIKSIHEARQRLVIKDSSSEINKLGNKKLPVVEDEKKKAAVWKPCFQLEDFMEDHHEAHHFNTSLLPLVSTPPSYQLQGSSKDKMGLDLDLSL